MELPRKRMYLFVLSVLFTYYAIFKFGFHDKIIYFTAVKATMQRHSQQNIDIFLPVHPHRPINDTVSLTGDIYNSLCKGTIPMSSAKFSKMTLNENIHGKVSVTIVTNDENNSPMSTGGDVLLIWALQENGDGKVSGNVTDYLNGTYKGVVQLHWTGRSIIKVKIASALKVFCLRYNSLNKYGNTVFAMKKGWGILGEYKRAGHHEKARCGPNPVIHGYGHLCNFTERNANMSWFCGAPIDKRLNCNDIYSFGTGPFYTPGVKSSEIIMQPGHGIISSVITVNTKDGRNDMRVLTKCYLRSKSDSWSETAPSGYWLNGTWHFINCDNNMRQSNVVYKTCLANKSVFIFGDSTLRQYLEYLVYHVLNMGWPNFVKYNSGPNRTYRGTVEFIRDNMRIVYKKPEMPFHNPGLPVNNITSLPQEIDKLATNTIPGHSLIVLVNYFSHFQAYPPSEFRLRIQRLVSSISNLLRFKPETTVLFKGPHVCIDDTRWFDSRISLMFREIMTEEFFSIRDKVIYLDTWSITVAHDNENLHPMGDAFESHIHQLMSYICEY